jgi:hypothetical protein
MQAADLSTSRTTPSNSDLAQHQLHNHAVFRPFNVAHEADRLRSGTACVPIPRRASILQSRNAQQRTGKPIRPASAAALAPVNLAKASGLESKREGRPK